MKDDTMNLVMKRFKPAFLGFVRGIAGSSSKDLVVRITYFLSEGPREADLGSQVVCNCPESEGCPTSFTSIERPNKGQGTR